MSRQIDTSKRLSEEDRQYLVERGNLDAVRANDAEFGEEKSLQAIDGGNTGDVDPFKRDDGSDLVSGTHPDERTLTPAQAAQTGVPMGGGRSVDPQVPGASQEPEDTRDYDKDYDEWSNADLQKEIDERNEDGRRSDEKRLSRSGTKAEMAKALEDDDDDPETDYDEGSGS